MARLKRILTAGGSPLADWLWPVDATDCAGGAECTCDSREAGR